MIYTSYFAKLKALPDNITPIAICAKIPDWYQGLHYKGLAPKYGFFREWQNNHDNNYYIRCFTDQVLNTLNPQEIYNQLRSMVPSGNDIVLICYEKPSDFCHRHLVAKWFTENGIPCEEYIFSK